MFKYLFCFLIIFFPAGIQQGCSQTGSDSAQTVETNPGYLFRPIADSNYMPMEPLREVPGKQVRKYLENIDYAYANDPEYWEKKAPHKPGIFYNLINSIVFRWLILFGVICVVFYGIYQLAKENSFSLLSRKGKQNNSVPAEALPGNDPDFESAIRKYQEEGNYRQAVRFMYLRLIHTARKNGGIQFRDSSTNAEITLAFGSHPQAVEFRYLARAFEYIFYGDFIPSQEIFDMLKNKFETFQEAISI